MIRYPITQADLEARVDAAKSDWRTRADERTTAFKAACAYSEPPKSFWSEIKGVFIELQGEGKCAFCERSLESNRYGKVEHDVEHFRPKKSVKPWRVPVDLLNVGVVPAPVPASIGGYYALTYHLLNYATACKPCNSTLKRDWFPIAGTYDTTSEHPAALSSERPFLIYPIGDYDEDPEELIEFHGTSPRPRSQDLHRRQRALLTIEFFRLDKPTDRKNLHRGRAEIIMLLYLLLRDAANLQGAEREKEEAEIDDLLQPRLPHLNCARSFQRLFQSSPQEARSVYLAVRQFLKSKS